ncbi:putative proline--tRNA ligase [Neolecta irregularis DAH-3]|uniref:proline--tRNA ligase n=1 Tax=Neolecta irregularis (strain DAH-3) TaxID=1198029 RepID=A0A1U7LGA3_NEOID|nr:putative proline--tRNA ligase [Neolecta irregularis DAH-3]|eukprot:OLL21686.1 putative proline--tRNA ligase [Neolecta irregularis DAH-3]
MTSEDVLTALKSLKIYAATIAHDTTPNAQAWREALLSHSTPFILSKTLAFKPKTPKSDTPVLILVVALESTDTNAAAVNKVMNVKDSRFATPELVKDRLGVAPDDVSPLSITSANASAIRVALDSKLVTSAKPIAFHPSASNKTVFLTSAQLQNYLESTGVEVVTAEFSAATLALVASSEATKASSKKVKEDAKIEGAALIGIDVKKEQDFPNWYRQVLTKGDILDYYDVSGCYIMKPGSYHIWETIQKFFDGEIKKLGVENAYFPMFVSSKALEKEKDHVEGFAPEVAWVTRAGSSDLEEPIAIRPTSETVMYPYYAKWIRSHRDLPLKINQWNSVVRWEFKHPQPFLRTREFLWQEGHTAFLTEKEAMEEVYTILDLYRQIYEDLLAVPVIKGIKSEKEKFAGGLKTTTVEGFIPTTGRGIQGGTSHCLGQNFSKMFGITVEDPKFNGEGEKPKLHVWQNSWGITTRTIGVMIMTHGDDKGLVFPPRVANTQVIVIPCGINAKVTDDDRNAVEYRISRIVSDLCAVGVRAKSDMRDLHSPGYKFNHWELRGVPLRIEFGPGDMKKSQVLSVRRDNGVKTPIALSNVEIEVPKLLETIQSDMFIKAKTVFDSRIKQITEWEKFVPALDSKNVVLVPWCERDDCEDNIKERSSRQPDDTAVDEKAPSMGAKSLCIPFDQPEGIVKGKMKCVACNQDASVWCLFGRSY